jgi:hypothetical protein
MIRTAGALAVVVATGVDEARRHAGCLFQTDRASVRCVIWRATET